MSESDVPGFDTVELLGYGSGGEVWLARDRATGSPVALKRLRVGADLAARDRLRREAAALAGVQHPHVVRLLAVHGEIDGLVLVLDLAAGGSLARLLAVRGPLTPGEVVTVAVPLAQALAAVHAQGLVHGDVTPANVLFAGDGRPMLSDLGVSRLRGVADPEGTGGVSGGVSGTSGYLDPAVLAGAVPGPAADVHGLAATCVAALTGCPPYDEDSRRISASPPTEGMAADTAALLAVLERALSPDPALRPDADAFAVALFDAVTPRPVRLDRSAAPVLIHPVRPQAPIAPPTHQAPGRLHPPSAGVDPVGPRRRRPGRGGKQGRGGRQGSAGRGGSAGRWARRGRGLLVALRGRARATAAVLAGSLAIGLAAIAGVAWAGADDGPAAVAVTGTPTPKPQPWAAVLGVLDQRRSRAFAAGDPAMLAGVYADAAPALGRDRVVLDQLRATGLRARGLRLVATSVRLTDGNRDATRVRLEVSDRMPRYQLVDRSGTVVERRPGRGARTWTVVLTRGGTARAPGWVVYDVVRG